MLIDEHYTAVTSSEEPIEEKDIIGIDERAKAAIRLVAILEKLSG